MTDPMAAPPRLEAPASLRTIGRRVEDRLDLVFCHEIARWSALDPGMAEPLDSLRRLVMAGGKRLRPAFCHWAFVGGGGEADDPVVVDAGAALEFLQAFALVHDDVMDGSSTRRGARTTHLDFADRHLGERWRGEARRFGEGVAILIGDLAHVYADLLLAEAPRSAIDVWNELRIELNVGQYLDIVGTAKGDTDHASARRIARYKSGKYTIERPLHVGAALADRLDVLSVPLSAYGDPLGEAFQLRDDLLGAFGDQDRTGKPVGDDLREGKPTPLLALTSRRAGAEQRRRLERIGHPDLTAEEVAGIQEVMVDTGAFAAVELSIEELTTTAIAAIEQAPITDEACHALVELAHYVAWRDA